MSTRRQLYRLITTLCIAVLCLPVRAQQQPKDPFDVEAREYLGTPQSEAAVRRGLEFLAQRQERDGHWNSGPYNADAAVTGLCTLAFLSAGHQPGRGKYGELLTRAVDWLAETVQNNGLIARGGSAGPPMYGHGFATLTLAELYGMTKRADFRPKLESAVQLIVSTQNAEGGWRYQPTVADADISVTAVQLMALRAAHNVGIKVPEETVKKAVGYIKRCANNPDGGFSYQAGTRGSGPARTGAGVTCLILSGERNSPECKGGIQYLLDHPLDAYEWAYRQHYMYALYYCTQAMYQVGGKPWKDWFTNVRERLIATQQPDGSWRDSPGQEYATAMAVLVLQVPAGLLPIYQK
ncbi:MAG TPA: prenyltransferase/squalene oxidase repeat-containing protein [Chthonomonadales bacterium]|nr:prenyltransferase/squalene oxidase repeat-containing protein [Chthonomonadales bacterium]